MSEHLENKVENIFNSIVESIADSVPKQKSVRFSEGQNAVTTQMNKLFGRQKSVHNILGGGKCEPFLHQDFLLLDISFAQNDKFRFVLVAADVLLWRNKKISSSVLTGATAIWVLFEWLNYHFLTLLCFALVIGMLIQFIWSNASGMLNRSPSEVPRLVLPDELFTNIAVSIGAQINQLLGFIQDVACGKNLKHFLMVVGSLWAAAVIGSWCNFLTLFYIGFVCAHTLPVLYEKYEDQVDDLVYNLIGQLQSQFGKLDKSVLSKIPKGNTKLKKNE
ncbi:Reticulon-like protein B8 [Cocos nucifera]|uniref:Reticulon-like protein n=1 Tax=Cocos nucifera TaxID=13894 RepID=A0A8K0IVE2_COCNU|nr:Reticulon-like protein B8 [Cocos nucifera]KAG1368433.1 Reticulon-like protein B8 [Cocos nucifera]